MGNFARNLAYALSAVPLLIKFPYLYSSWTGSPFEKYDAAIWVLIFPAAALCEIARRAANIPRGAKKCKIPALFALISSLALYAAFAFKFNASGIFFGIAIIAAATELRFGRNVMIAQIPTFLLAMLTIPNLSFWAEYCISAGFGGIVPFFFAKLAIALLLFALWIARTLYLKRFPRYSSIAFCALACIALFCAAMRMKDVPPGDAAEIGLEQARLSEWVGVDMPNMQSDFALFSGAESVRRKTFYSDSSKISVLAIESEKVSDMHPIEICLKSANLKIERSSQIYIFANGKKIQANEIIFFRNAEKFAIYSFYSGKNISTGFFTKFRLAHKGEKWRHYQVQISAEASEDEARAEFEKFMSAACK